MKKKDEDYFEKVDREIDRAITFIGGVLLAIILLLAFSGCSTSRTTLTTHSVDTLREVRTDTVFKTKTLRDSVFLKEHIYARGDTVFRDILHYKNITIRDTVWQWKTKVVYKTKEREEQKVVEKKKSWLQKIIDAATTLSLLILVALGLGGVIAKLKG